MTPTNERPEWACPEWGSEHDWLNCPDCLLAQGELIEHAQDDADVETVEQR